jgi:glycosyltransferase involved in cell wall biosynthesis
MRGLAQRGVRQLLIAPGGPLAERVRPLGIAVTEWRPRGDLDGLAAFAASRVLRDHAPDLVHAHDARSHAVGWLAARLARVPRMVVSRRTVFPAGTHPASRLKYGLPVDRYLAVSASVRTSLRAAHVPAANIRVVPSGIELAGPPDAASLRQEWGLDERTIVIGVVASLTAEKGQDLAIDALARLAHAPPLHLALVGEGRLHEALRVRARQRGVADRVHFAGFRGDARALLRQFDLCLVPSRAEGLGTAALEAQAEGVPVIASAVGGLPEVVENDVTGRLVPAENVGALASAIADALADPERMRNWVAQAREVVRSHDVDRTVGETLAVYEDVLQDPRLDGAGGPG